MPITRGETKQVNQILKGCNKARKRQTFLLFSHDNTGKKKNTGASSNFFDLLKTVPVGKKEVLQRGISIPEYNSTMQNRIVKCSNEIFHKFEGSYFLNVLSRPKELLQCVISKFRFKKI